ncbi:hypothetical protein CCR97_04200 [Rhodoplanes elegans]|uniref:Uncharacterized protein n=1 Tax=Rhodoplanes elegans TaxID=29408 RepID=A0A327KNH9_9BRAD|nr:hypothetical protein [Rhodoplanes elegans]MBK5957411.1 hypothetical protein [Rhodoplanes elegans]RAI39534.1 hypothetical protein CH338_09175 [Rhodoplanes elegans]
MKRHGTVDFDQLVAAEKSLRAVDKLWRSAGYSRAGARGWAHGEEFFSVTLTWRRAADNGMQLIATYTIKRLRRR